MRHYKFRVKKGRGKQPWRLQLIAGNGEMVMSSEGYACKRNALRSLEAMANALLIEDAWWNLKGLVSAGYLEILE